MIAIVDYGMGNLGSIANMLRKIGTPGTITADPGQIADADRLILPGVGAFDRGMQALDELDLLPVLNRRVLDDGVPVLGICLGMQLLGRRSEEGERPGLGWIEGDVVRIEPPAGSGLKVPHMGWNLVRPTRPSSLFPAEEAGRDDLRFYFVHSFHLVCDDEADVACTTPYGVELTSGVAAGNVTGVQFHPEKSHRFGLELLGRFAAGEPARTG